MEQLNDIAHEHDTIICRQLFAGHVVDSRSKKRKKHLHQMIIRHICICTDAYFCAACIVMYNHPMLTLTSTVIHVCTVDMIYKRPDIKFLCDKK